MRVPLPIDDHLAEIASSLLAHRALVLSAPPGAGKTTRVPPSLVDQGPLIVLEPRRMAARAVARRIAAEQGWRLGDEIGWQVRFERRFSERTRLLVATEGVLTARLQGDPLLSRFRTVVLDEFHERSVHADLALALIRQAMQARDDLRVVVMSATLDPGPVARFLDGCPTLEVAGRLHPVEVSYTPGITPAAAIRDRIERGGGHVLCFLPGAPEIRRLAAELRRRPRLAAAVDILPLHGSLSAARQDAALAPSRQRKLILATNIAETSLTVQGVTDVIDAGWHKVLRRDPAIGIDRLETERIPLDSAEQRAGRAGREGPGRAERLWDAREILRPRREPEIARADLCRPFLDVLIWGCDPLALEWFEPPPREHGLEALELLERLGASRRGRVTELGRLLGQFPLHPRLARVLVEAGGSPLAARACAILAEGWNAPEPGAATRCDLLTLADRLSEAPSSVRAAARDLARLARRQVGASGDGDEERRLLRALLAGYPDRVARRREPGSSRMLLASGHGARLAPSSGVVGGELLLALELAPAPRGPGSESIIRLASLVEPAWLEPTETTLDHELDREAGVVRAVERRWYGKLVLGRRTRPPDPETAAAMLSRELLARGPGPEGVALLRRLRFAGLGVELDTWCREACEGQTRLPAFDLRAWLPVAVQRQLQRLAPERLELPSGRRAPLSYDDEGGVRVEAKLQELFGLATGPRIGAEGVPVTFVLLAPNGRAVQTTRDLRSFWESTYPEVRKELRGRYPRHPWPEDPWTARPTRSAKRSGRRS